MLDLVVKGGKVVTANGVGDFDVGVQGDKIAAVALPGALDVEARRLHLDVTDADLEARRRAWTAPAARHDRGYASLYIDHVLQADCGVDFDFLVGGSGAPVPRESH